MEYVSDDLNGSWVFFSRKHPIEESGAESIGLWLLVCTICCLACATYYVRIWLFNDNTFFTCAQFRLNHGPRSMTRCFECLMWAVKEINNNHGSLQINKRQCQILSTECRTMTESYMPRFARQDFVLQELFCAVRKALKLVQDCCTEDWILKAVEFGNCREHFLEVLRDLHGLNVMTKDPESHRGEPVDMTDPVIDERVTNSMATARKSDKTDLMSKVQSNGSGHFLANQLKDIPASLDAPPEIGELVKDLDLRTTRFIYPVPPVKSLHEGILVFRVALSDKEFVIKMRWSKRGAEEPENCPEKLRDEAKVMKECYHPYAVGLLGYWEHTSATGKVPLLLMESMECNLKDLIDKRSRTMPYLWGGTRGFPALDAIKLVLPVAKALRHLHSIGVVHRDLKPENILFTHVSETEYLPADISVKLADFGEAEKVKDAKGVKGTIGYMDPNVWGNGENVDHKKADVFSFGLVFGEVLTGLSPGEALDCMDDVYHAVKRKDFHKKLENGDRPELPKDTPEFVKSIVKRCLDRTSAARPSFKEICSRLQYWRF